jgi:hypothetical protein
MLFNFLSIVSVGATVPADVFDRYCYAVSAHGCSKCIESICFNERLDASGHACTEAEVTEKETSYEELRRQVFEGIVSDYAYGFFRGKLPKGDQLPILESLKNDFGDFIVQPCARAEQIQDLRWILSDSALAPRALIDIFLTIPGTCWTHSGEAPYLRPSLMEDPFRVDLPDETNKIRKVGLLSDLSRVVRFTSEDEAEFSRVLREAVESVKMAHSLDPDWVPNDLYLWLFHHMLTSNSSIRDVSKRFEEEYFTRPFSIDDSPPSPERLLEAFRYVLSDFMEHRGLIRILATALDSVGYTDAATGLISVIDPQHKPLVMSITPRREHYLDAIVFVVDRLPSSRIDMLNDILRFLKLLKLEDIEYEMPDGFDEQVGEPTYYDYVKSALIKNQCTDAKIGIARMWLHSTRSSDQSSDIRMHEVLYMFAEICDW